MSAPAQAVHLPIYHGTITTRTNSNERDPKVGDSLLVFQNLLVNLDSMGTTGVAKRLFD